MKTAISVLYLVRTDSLFFFQKLCKILPGFWFVHSFSAVVGLYFNKTVQNAQKTVIFCRSSKTETGTKTVIFRQISTKTERSF